MSVNLYLRDVNEKLADKFLKWEESQQYPSRSNHRHIYIDIDVDVYTHIKMCYFYMISND